ncbi:MAG: hypothetical protein WD825_06620 [Gemmatimonadaceae bacterium]
MRWSPRAENPGVVRRGDDVETAHLTQHAGKMLALDLLQVGPGEELAESESPAFLELGQDDVLRHRNGIEASVFSPVIFFSGAEPRWAFLP